MPHLAGRDLYCPKMHFPQLIHVSNRLAIAELSIQLAAKERREAAPAARFRRQKNSAATRRRKSDGPRPLPRIPRRSGRRNPSVRARAGQSSVIGRRVFLLFPIDRTLGRVDCIIRPSIADNREHQPPHQAGVRPAGASFHIEFRFVNAPADNGARSHKSAPLIENSAPPSLIGKSWSKRHAKFAAHVFQTKHGRNWAIIGGRTGADAPL
jgi:hypothetical protein